MKSISFLAASFAIAMSSALCSCSNEDKEITTMSNKSYIEISKAQSDFIKDMNNISEKYQNINTRAVTQEDIATASKWILNAGVDALGGMVGGAALSWITSAAASSLYNAYLDNIIDQGRSVQQHIDVTTNAEYNNLYKEMAFVFCDNKATNKLDSIGYIHNEILNKFMAETNNRSYILNNKIDFQNFCSDYKQVIEKLDYPTDDIDKAFNQNTIAFLENIISSFAKVQINPQNYHEALNSILSLRADNIDTVFLSTLIESIIQSFPKSIPAERLSSYFKEINNAINDSKLNDKETVMCKSLLQTMSCSYLYWKFSEL